MKPDRTYEEILSDMRACVENTDTEIAHINADNILKELALRVDLTTQERYKVIQMWESVSKWYA